MRARSLGVIHRPGSAPLAPPPRDGKWTPALRGQPEALSLYYAELARRAHSVLSSIHLYGNVTKQCDDSSCCCADTSGIITATAFHGDGANLTGVSGFADAQGRDCGLQHVFTTPVTLTLGGPGCGIKTITATAAQGNLAFIRAKNLTIATGSTIHVSAGTTIKTNVLNLF